MAVSYPLGTLRTAISSQEIKAALLRRGGREVSVSGLSAYQ